MPKFTIGADPELFVQDANGLACAHGLVRGDKSNPQPVTGGAVQVDGIALEFNIDPVEGEDAFVDSINNVMCQLEGMIEDKEFLIGSTVHFDEDWRDSVPQESLELGCEADFNAWHRCMNNPPNQEALMRTAGGHVHIGFTDVANPYTVEHIEKCATIVKLLDKYLGMPSIMWDNDDERRTLYGKAGSFRPKKYGLEYRTLPNTWIWNSELIRKVYRGVEQAMQAFEQGKTEVEEYVQEVINNSDRQMYQEAA